jgi:hypothetical protein
LSCAVPSLRCQRPRRPWPKVHRHPCYQRRCLHQVTRRPHRCRHRFFHFQIHHLYRPPANSTSSIGAAEMDLSGTIRLHLHAPTRSTLDQSILPVVPRSAAEERFGYGEIELNRWDLHYDDILRHLGGLRPGQIKPVPPWRAEEKWHCALDPDRGPCPLQHLLPGRTALR